MTSQPIKPSIVSMRTSNPIRAIVDSLKVTPNPAKSMLSLALGDPTTFGNYKLHQSCVDAVKNKLDAYSANGYPPSIGTVAARTSIAAKYTHPNAPLTADDIILASGCSDALNLCIGVLCDEGKNILLPMPGFPLYETLASSKGVSTRFYHLQPHNNWQVDLAHLESQIDENTACIVVNNPSNPCGSVYTKEHLIAILDIAERHHLPIIADEIYADMAFKPHEFFSMASLTTNVPILSTGGIAKKYLVPGWRVGWLFIHDRHNKFSEIRKGLVNLSQLILGANSLIQAAIPEILAAPQSFYDDTMKQLEESSHLSQELLKGIPGLCPVFPQGAMYLMIELKLEEFDGIKDDVDFVEKLVEEESVLLLPGKCFRCPGPFVRIVLTPPKDQLETAYQRIRAFCERHQSAASIEKQKAK